MNQVPNAHKWTEERVSEHLIEIHHDAFQGDVMYLGRALVRQGLYPEVWSYWKKIFVKNGNIIEAMLQIEAIFEARLFEGALKKDVSPWVAIFGLKNNHKWCDKHEPEPEERKGSPMIIELTEDTIVIVDDGFSGTFKRIEETMPRAEIGMGEDKSPLPPL